MLRQIIDIRPTITGKVIATVMLFVTIVLFHVTAPAQFSGSITPQSSGSNQVHVVGSINSTFYQILSFFGFGSDDNKKGVKPKVSPMVDSVDEIERGQEFPIRARSHQPLRVLRLGIRSSPCRALILRSNWR
ncbi:MAG: hypothetical protein IPQ00_00280 [Chloracidobacterium sp.]|nr:hypothetical protein [Chloracidobacterium sp.]